MGMNYGKLNEDVYGRSVVKVMKETQNKNFYNGAEIGDFCAVFPCGGHAGADRPAKGFISAQASAGGKNAVIRSYEAALNGIVSKGVVPGKDDNAYASITLFIPKKLREAKVRAMLAETAKRAGELQIPVLGVAVQVLPWVDVETANCVVHMELDGKAKGKGASPGDDIVMTKWIGLEGTALIARSSRDRLRERYPSDIVETAAGFLDDISVLPEAATAVESGASDMQAVREGGLFGGLWELAAKNSVGLVADLKRIPVRQETIEVCEYFDLNPYELMAAGSLLITCPKGNAMVKALADRGIASAVIGTVTQGNDRIVRHADESRFLEPVRGDELYRYYEKKDGKEHSYENEGADFSDYRKEQQN